MTLGVTRIIFILTVIIVVVVVLARLVYCAVGNTFLPVNVLDRRSVHLSVGVVDLGHGFEFEPCEVSVKA